MSKPGILSESDDLPRMKMFLIGCWFLLFSACSDAQNPYPATSNLYFPPNESATWEETASAGLGWNEAELAKFLAWLPKINF
jgi:hypothetical protein